MPTDPDVSAHYTSGKLLERLRAQLAAEGVDPDRPTIEALAPFDHFHGRGLEATRELASSVSVAASDHILDVGSGIGGPARYFAARFCEVARILTRAVGLADRVAFEQGSALAMPFADASFDGAYSMNVAMNIADKRGFYGEMRRVLKSGAWLVLSEIAQGPGGAPAYPTPWAATAATSFLATPGETRRALEDAGFTVVTSRDTIKEAVAFAARSRAMVERGEKPPFGAVRLMHGDLAAPMTANGAQALAEARIIPIEVVCRKT